MSTWTPSGTTSLAAVIGTPIRHSRSPAILNAAFRALDLDWAYLAFDVADGDAARAIDAVRTLGIGGLSVTMPHKAAVVDLVDDLTDDARVLGAVNCVTQRDGRLLGDNTDGGGFIAALTDRGVSVGGRTCVVLGAGGAARAVVLALARAGAASVVVVNRTRSRAEDAAALAGAVGVVGSDDAITGADLIVNATSVGMGARVLDGPDASASASVPFPLDLIRAVDPPIVVDLVYQPLVTPLLRGAGRAGSVTVDGLGMLVHQAALAFRSWTGSEPPIEVMRAAAEAAAPAETPPDEPRPPTDTGRSAG